MSDDGPSFSAQPTDAVGKIGILRIVDAEANRAAEGLRVVEDYVRFVLDDRHLTELAKQLRHDLTAALRQVPSAHRLAARESQADVGTVLAAPAGSERTAPADVAAASFKRVQQALRSLEEYGKLLDTPTLSGITLAAAPEAGSVASEIEKIRFRSYTLERAVGITADSLTRLSDARLYVLIDGCADEAKFTRLVETLVAAGVHVLQLRDKQLPDPVLLSRARILREITRRAAGVQKSTLPHPLFIMNDRPDLAVLSAADGVHVGQEELSVKDTRAIVGPHALIGVSTHNINQARRAVLDGANYIGVGPTFPSATKKFDSFPGLDFVRAVAVEISLPAFAIGGITLENVPQVIEAGLRRVAVSGAVVGADDVTEATRDFLARLAF